ncbi:MAG: DNA-cytosine methyltransferase [Candidatus Doudnabacteria bacterium RIFCSPLOWO2_02_FULL_49_13]|uniref:DNA-cytosine methyltransferase n=1 Tax=Candidatus Doudnabacteria bacterium RIFCSPHIGHO2_12_FULL_48_16 TaxID=1817838 RepID=A0A1F5PM62_9BACT|nr:MAG: DNA-cytosine methyltransferase [Candidatus Doudnabacteria bacterium RIFCSPHIGHO2_02_FULL_49_24]OGE89146.1 MAG: DNA-cytosine methyltransferase [Candidatus Doudnabacteria bacterium RIFCSPHIGHO2_01_FULL_50_67]OGE90752.1 MAG: DNA-cytosine methyltransferase [Candidatus Doudnabacteria bacterium RIFCSPHIGHO2_12_FULL_48_16]OGE97326.1 MAG: DNA-cytosine methyltransferase [Candidatus Doudnabacteria bacterium RIFCSPLOWO2_01_FULL_49_40]OGF02615.1 MAG: DNA-cytosine methyltransferase [Candidatus Doudn
MKLIYNNPKIKSRRQQLRKNQTDCESLLWKVLRNKQCNDYKFLRQYSVGYYILDFYCPELRLAIELDGGQHADEQKEYDQERTAYLLANDIRELRFWNNEVIENIDGIYDKILEYCPKN